MVIPRAKRGESMGISFPAKYVLKTMADYLKSIHWLAAQITLKQLKEKGKYIPN